MQQPDSPMAARVMEIAKEALPGEPVRAAFQGMLRPSPLVMTVVPAGIVIAVYVMLAVAFQPPPLVGLALVVVGLVVVLFAFTRWFVESALFVVTNTEIVAIELSLGRTGRQLGRHPRHVETLPFWDPRYLLVIVDGQRAYVAKRLYAPLIEELAA